jgi:hypothetical protein
VIVKLVTDGEKWAIKRWSWLGFCFEYFNFRARPDDLQWYLNKNIEGIWTDKETAKSEYDKFADKLIEILGGVNA